jgi:hypothetical protein
LRVGELVLGKPDIEVVATHTGVHGGHKGSVRGEKELERRTVLSVVCLAVTEAIHRKVSRGGGFTYLTPRPDSAGVGAPHIPRM